MLHKAETIWNGRGTLAVGPVPSGAGPTPAALWMPAGEAPVSAVVLLGHGGSTHKRGTNTSALAEILVTRYGFAAAAIDGPVHGDRQPGGPVESLEQRERFLAYWREPGNAGDAIMTAGWSGLIDGLLALPRLAGARVGYAGVSMGTAYGLPLLASEARISAGVLGMWGADYPASAHLAVAAQSVRCPVLFLQRWDDQMFSRDGTLALFDALGSADKRHLILTGPHSDLVDEARVAALSFLVERLAAG